MTLPNEILLEEVASLLAEGKDVELMTKGASMLPFIIGDRDSVILRKEIGRTYVPGDIVLARRNPGNYVLHRVIDVDGGTITLKGDGNIFGTEIVNVGDIIGRVEAIVDLSGRSRVPGKARLWRTISPLARRCILALYKRTIYKIINR